jgi:hypothetical protein
MAGQQATYSRRALNRLRKPPGNGLESGGGAPDLSDDRIKSSIEAARARFRKIAERAKARGEDVTPEQRQVLSDAEAALKALATEGESAQLSDRQRIGLEAIVVPDGTRPALFVQDDDVDPNAADAGTWQGRISAFRTELVDVARSVGRINSNIGFPNYAGTGWVVANGLIVTNKHVLEFLAGRSTPLADGTWRFLQPVTIDFAAEFQRPRQRSFKITGVKFASPDSINGTLQPSNLDVAILTVETNNGSEDLPPPLPLSRRPNSLNTQAPVYVMGYPARPNDEFGEVLMRVFGDEFFVKRFAPGFVESPPDQVTNGKGRVFTHDSSTLGGNSGSCVIEFNIAGRAAVGLHFGGLARRENYAHSLGRLDSILTDEGAMFQD